MNSETRGVTLMIDSGIGGLSVLALSHQRLPNENFFFYADAANAPYGDKSPAEVRALLHNILRICSDVPVKAILLACNTATSAAAALLREELSIPVLGMEPALKPAVLNSEGQIIVMATALTIREEKFQNLLEKFGKGRDIIPLPCPGLMQLVEKNPLGQDTEAYLCELLEPYKNTLSSVVLGCTHYVFLRPMIHKLFPQAQLFDGNEGVVRHLSDVLRERKCLGGSGIVSVDCSFVMPEEKKLYLEKCQTMLEFCRNMYSKQTDLYSD